MIRRFLSGALDYAGPVLYGLRCWRRATLHDPQYYEPDVVA